MIYSTPSALWPILATTMKQLIRIQLEHEKLALETKLKKSEDTVSQLQLENSTLTERVKELDDSKSLVISLEEKIARLEEDSVKKNASDAGLVIFLFYRPFYQ